MHSTTDLTSAPAIKLAPPFYAIDSVELMAGSLPKRQQRLVKAWAAFHQDDLLRQLATAASSRVQGKAVTLGA